jgi:hypothetical protein
MSANGGASDSHLRHKTGGPGFDSRWGIWKFSSKLIRLSEFSSSGVHLASNINVSWNFLGGKVWLARRTDNSAEFRRIED